MGTEVLPTHVKLAGQEEKLMSSIVNATRIVLVVVVVLIPIPNLTLKHVLILEQKVSIVSGRECVNAIVQVSHLRQGFGSVSVSFPVECGHN